MPVTLSRAQAGRTKHQHPELQQLTRRSSPKSTCRKEGLCVRPVSVEKLETDEYRDGPRDCCLRSTGSCPSYPRRSVNHLALRRPDFHQPNHHSHFCAVPCVFRAVGNCNTDHVLKRAICYALRQNKKSARNQRTIGVPSWPDSENGMARKKCELS